MMINALVGLWVSCAMALSQGTAAGVEDASAKSESAFSAASQQGVQTAKDFKADRVAILYKRLFDLRGKRSSLRKEIKELQLRSRAQLAQLRDSANGIGKDNNRYHDERSLAAKLSEALSTDSDKVVHQKHADASPFARLHPPGYNNYYSVYGGLPYDTCGDYGNADYGCVLGAEMLELCNSAKALVGSQQDLGEVVDEISEIEKRISRAEKAP